jgi:hypothetical protein
MTTALLEKMIATFIEMKYEEREAFSARQLAKFTGADVKDMERVLNKMVSRWQLKYRTHEPGGNTSPIRYYYKPVR